MFKDIFVRYSISTGVVSYVIGWFLAAYGVGWLIANRSLLVCVLIILPILFVLVSYKGNKQLQVVNPYLFLFLVAIFFVFRFVFLFNSLEDFRKGNLSSTESGPKQWVISPDVKPGSDTTRHLVCTLQDSKYCFSFKTPNLLIYRPYQLCNIVGKLFYKEQSRVGTYDLLKRTYFVGNNVKVVCNDSWISKLFDVRERIANKIDNLIPKPQSSLLNGIIFGMDLSFTSEFERSIQAAGISHIVAASGYNVSILVLALDKFVGRLPVKFELLIKIVFVWFYALLTGFSSSMVRASAMTTISFLTQIFFGESNVKDVFWLTLAVLIAINPLVVFDLGFLLSASATFGLMYISPVLEQKVGIKGFPHTTLACTLVTLPITMLHFQTFSPYSVIANMLILPVIEIVMLLGIFGLIFSPLIYLAWGCLKFVEVVAGVFTKLPHSIVELSNASSIILAIIVALIMFYLLRGNYERKSFGNNS